MITNINNNLLTLLAFSSMYMYSETVFRQHLAKTYRSYLSKAEL